jgi:hypothetical protein
MPARGLLPGALGVLAHSSTPRGSVPARDREPAGYEAAAALLEAALVQATGNPGMQAQLGDALQRLRRVPEAG